MSRYQNQVKIRERAACDGAMTRCPHCGESLTWEPEPERIRWYIPDDGAPRRVSTLGEKLLDSLRTNGRAVYISSDGRNMRRMGIAIAAAPEPGFTIDDREPIIVTPEDFARNWRPAGRAVRTAGGAR